MQTEPADQFGKVFDIGPGRVRPWGRRVLIRKAIAPAVCDYSKAAREGLELRLPGAVVTHSAVQKNDRRAASLLNVAQVCAVDMYVHRCGGARGHRRAERPQGLLIEAGKLRRGHSWPRVCRKLRAARVPKSWEFEYHRHSFGLGARTSRSYRLSATDQDVPLDRNSRPTQMREKMLMEIKKGGRFRSTRGWRKARCGLAASTYTVTDAPTESLWITRVAGPFQLNRTIGPIVMASLR